MTKVCVRWVPRMLDQKMKDCRRETSSENLKVYAVEMEFVCEAHRNWR